MTTAVGFEDEGALLSGLLLLPEAIEDADVRALRTEDFASLPHRCIFAAMLALREDGTAIDATSVKAALTDRGQIETTAAAFERVRDEMGPGTDNLGYLAKRVVAAASRRSLAAVGADCAQSWARGAVTPESLVSMRKAIEKAESEGHRSRPIVVRMDRVVAEPVTWLWDGWLPEGEFCLIDGDPGLGKSTLTIEIAAHVSEGRALPGQPTGRGARTVLFVAPEDHMGRVLRPRLEEAGADLTKVFTFAGHGPSEDNIATPPRIPTDIDLIRGQVVKYGAALVVIDNLFNCLAAETNSSKDHDVRRALWPLASLAKETGACIVAIRHLNKMAGGAALYRGGGSIGIIGAARAGLLVAKDPQDETARVVACNKSNLGIEPRSLRFRVVSAGTSSRVEWLGECDLRPADLLATPELGEEGAHEQAQEFLRDVLRDGPVPATEVQKMARAAGLSDRTIQRARGQLRIKPTKHGFSGKWVLSLPKTANAEGMAAFDAAGAEEARNTSNARDVSSPPKDRQHEERQPGLAAFGGTGEVGLG